MTTKLTTTLQQVSMATMCLIPWSRWYRPTPNKTEVTRVSVWTCQSYKGLSGGASASKCCKACCAQFKYRYGRLTSMVTYPNLRCPQCRVKTALIGSQRVQLS
eukprot:3544789-Amphidinium_carterae.1